MTLPEIDITIDLDKWPNEEQLTHLIAKSVESVAIVAELKWPNGAELSLLFTDDAKMSGINAEWRDKNQPTNVLSFPGSDIEIGEQSDFMIGDLVFAYETVSREAIEQEKRFDDHLVHLIIHGFLHLFGYDHIEDEEAEQMEAIEIASLTKIGINDPYANL